MVEKTRVSQAAALPLMVLVSGAVPGCKNLPRLSSCPPGGRACAKAGPSCPPEAPPHYSTAGPRECALVDQPFHVIQPPDVLMINAVRLVPLSPYRIQPLDALAIQFPAEAGNLSKESVSDLVLAGRSLGGAFQVEPDGTVNLGPVFGRVTVVDQTVEEIQAAVTERVLKMVQKALVELGKVQVTLAEFRGMQQIQGEHLVRPDGTISLGVYGFVQVSGLNQLEARAAVERHLSQFLYRPEISLDVAGINSKIFYVIFDGGGYGEQVARLPVMGKETVLDALGQLNGLPAVSSRHRIWIARPSCHGCPAILPVDWKGITQKGLVATNYQVFPGDRIYVQADPLITWDTMFGRFVAPIERLFGVTLLGTSVIRNIEGQNQGLGGTGF